MLTGVSNAVVDLRSLGFSNENRKADYLYKQFELVLARLAYDSWTRILSISFSAQLVTGIHMNQGQRHWTSPEPFPFSMLRLEQNHMHQFVA